MFTILDFGSEEPDGDVSTPTMVLEIATVLLGAFVGVAAVLYAAPRGYLGHPRRRGSNAVVTSIETYTPATEQESVTPVAEVPAEVEPAPSPAPALYETVQPAPAPVIYSAPSPTATTTFGASSAPKKPTRTYRRRSAPARSSVPRTTKSVRTRKR